MSNIGRKIKREIARRTDKPRGQVPARLEDNDPGDANRTGSSVVARRTQMSYWAGPLPSPEDVAEFNMVYPDAGKIIFTELSSQGEHRRWMEKHALVGAQRRSWGGLIAGVVVTLVGILCGTYAVVHGHDLAGGGIVTVNLVSLAGIFVYGRKQQADDLAKKREKAKKVIEPPDNEETN